ncbi:hypothetical protein [Natronincola ferrireducens]|uniref:Uncharacterized protein n=1 Tax=Natronincola ferrireducens TaxID=393762 RepID=A0A1G9DSS1_9FIRM|nr:hypothetical protein [Natronincola ferrireducens]SDK66872.1 hypothetical protein SAMN05660472_01720 [Natronincola ferrireducens]
MTPNEIKRLEEFLEDSFGAGVYFRELRLSNEEMEYVKRKYPRAELKKCVTRECSDGKIWWEVNLLSNQKNFSKEIKIEKNKVTIEEGA